MTWLKRGLALIAFGVVLYLFWPIIGELRDSADMFLRVRWEWLAVAVLLQVLAYACLTRLNHLLLRPFEGRIGFWRLMALLTSFAFIEVAVPSGGASGVVLRARFLGRSGYSVEAATFTLALETIYEIAVRGLASLVGLMYLLYAGHLSPNQVVVLAGVILFGLGAGMLVGWAGRDRKRATGWILSLVAHWNRLAQKFHWPPQTLEAVTARVDQFYEGLARLGRAPRWPFWLATLGHVGLDVASLGACFAAFGYAISPGVLLIGYGLTLLLSGLAALPGGLGLADISTAVIYDRLNAPGAVAVAAALTYRLIAFWLLRFAGFVTWQLLENEQP